MAARSAVVTAIGLTLAAINPSILIILPYYGLLFLLAIPVLGWSARRMALLAALAAVTTPLVSHLLRMGARPAGVANVTWDWVRNDLADALGALFLTGTYPVLTWSTYLFAGMAVGRLALGGQRVAGQVALAGAVLALFGWGLGQRTLTLVGRPTVAAELPGGPAPTDYLDAVILHRFFGSPPTDEWWWLGIQAPHIGTTPDLVHTTGTALAVLGICLLIVPRVGTWARPLVAAGSMTLTLYTAHVVAVRILRDLESEPRVAELSDLAVWLTQVGIALVFAMAWGSPGRRGPLEALAAAAARLAAGPR